MTSTAEPVTPVNPRSRVIVASLIGTSIEFYDFYVYATAAVLVFPTLFFPNENPTAAQLSSFVTFALAFFARPVGSIIFGHFGDRHGRKVTLVASLLVMGIATFLIGLLPTFDAWGIAAPAALAILRFGQGLGLGGEWSGAALLAIENAPQTKRAIYGTFPQLGAPIGFIIANGLFLILSLTMSPEQFAAWGWRIPFLLSAVLVVVGLYVRLKLVETPVYQRSLERGERVRVPLAAVVTRSWRPLILGTFIMLATYVLFYFMTTFTLTYGTAPAEAAEGAKAGLGYSRPAFLVLLLIGVVFFGLLTPVAGILADRFGRRRTLIVTTILIALFGLTFQVWFAQANDPSVVAFFLIAGLALMGLTFGPMGALLPELFPTNTRYTGSAIAYNVASILGASLAPTVALALWSADGNIFLVGLYLTIAAVITLVALFISKETRDTSLTGEPQEAELGSAGSLAP
jgi:metabolite-proton symporter